MLLDYLVYCLVGKLLIFLWQQFPLSSYLSSKWKPLQKLFSCDLCFGVWVYWFLAVIFEQVNPFLNIVDKYIPSNPELSVFMYLFTAFLIGALTSFIVHIFSLGWNSKFQVLVVENK